MLQLHCHVLQRGQAERHRACAHSILIICTLNHNNNNMSQKYWCWQAASARKVTATDSHVFHVDFKKASITCTFSIMTENPLSVQSLASRYWQRPVKVKNLLSKVLKWDWPTTKHSPAQTTKINEQPWALFTSRMCLSVHLSHRGSLHWCTPRNRDGTRCRAETI